MKAASRNRYEGDFVAWHGGALFLSSGGSAAIAPHAHYAVQLVLGTPSGLRVQWGRGGDWQDAAAALIPSRAVHSIDVTDCGMSAVIFVEPETAEGKALTARLRGRPEILGPDSIAPATDRLARAWRTERNADAVRTACMQLVRELAQTTQREPSDPRVLQAVEHLRRRVGQAVTLEEVAALVNLSPSRFRHLFVQETGMPLRTYALWRRLLHVWELLMQGETLSRAAHAAGFADSAHLSRTSKTMFGLSPSVMQMTGPLSAGSPGR